MAYIEILASLLIFNCVYGELGSYGSILQMPNLEIVGPTTNRIGDRTEAEREPTKPDTTESNIPITPSVITTNPVPPEECHNKDCSSETVIYCPAESGKTELGNVVFPNTLAGTGTIAHVACPSGFRSDGQQPIFEKIGLSEPGNQMRESMSGVYRNCTLKTEFNEILGVEKQIGQWSPANIADSEARYCRLQEVVEKSDQLKLVIANVDKYNIRGVLPLMEALLPYAKDDYVFAILFIDSISKVLETEGISPALLISFTKMIESYSESVILSPGYRVRHNTSTIVFETALFPTDWQDHPKLSETHYIPIFPNSNLNISIPYELLKMAEEQDVSPRLQITGYNSKVFALWNNDTEEDEFLGSYRIVSAQFLGAHIDNLTEPFVYTLPVNISVDGYAWICVYWNTTEKKWISDGIKTVTLEDNKVQCESSHLTAFSAILDPVPFPGSSLSPISEEHSRILGILSSIGSALSIAGLFMTALTYGLFRCLRKDRSNRILFHLCLSLLLLHLISVSQEKYLWNYKCFVPSALSHYLLLTSLCWMLIEALYMFQLLISVFVKPEAHFMLKRAAFAWGNPLLVVLICAAVDSEVYREGRDNLCIVAATLNLPLYYSAYLGPAVLILAINSFIFCRIAKVLYKQGAHNKKQRMMTSALNQTGQIDWKQIKKLRTGLISPTQIKGALTVMILVGVGWVFALFAIGPFQLFFKYLFVICNAGQGVFIFIFRVVLHPSASRTWKTVLLGISTDSDSSTSFGNSNKRQSMQSFSVSPTFLSVSNSAESTLTRSDPMTAKLANNLVSILRASDPKNLTDMKSFPAENNEQK